MGFGLGLGFGMPMVSISIIEMPSMNEFFNNQQDNKIKLTEFHEKLKLIY